MKIQTMLVLSLLLGGLPVWAQGTGVHRLPANQRVPAHKYRVPKTDNPKQWGTYKPWGLSQQTTNTYLPSGDPNATGPNPGPQSR